MAKQTVLLVDADRTNAQLLVVALRKGGYSVTHVVSAAEALEAIEMATPDVVLSDTQLAAAPDSVGAALALGREGNVVDGFQLCRRLKDDPVWYTIPFLFVSSSQSIEDKIHGLELGVEDYLTKPIYVKEILTRLQLVLARKQREAMDERTSKASFSGLLSEMGLVDLLSTIDLGRKTGTLDLQWRAQKGVLWFRDGRVLDARLGRYTGAAAVYRLFHWTEGNFELRFGPVTAEDVCELSTQGLLMEGMRRLDEWQRLLEQLPPLEQVLEVDPEILAEKLSELPDELNALLRCFDGRRTLLEVIDASGLDDLQSLETLSKLFFEGLIIPKQEEPAEESGARLPSRIPTPATGVKLPAGFESDIQGLEGSGDLGTLLRAPAPAPVLPAGPTVAEEEPRPGSESPRRYQERDVSKHRGKRKRSKRDVVEGSRSGGGSASANVIQFPRASDSEEESSVGEESSSGEEGSEEQSLLPDEKALGERLANTSVPPVTVPSSAPTPSPNASSEKAQLGASPTPEPVKAEAPAAAPKVEPSPAEPAQTDAPSAASAESPAARTPSVRPPQPIEPTEAAGQERPLKSTLIDGSPLYTPALAAAIEKVKAELGDGAATTEKAPPAAEAKAESKPADEKKPEEKRESKRPEAEARAEEKKPEEKRESKRPEAEARAESKPADEKKPEAKAEEKKAESKAEEKKAEEKKPEEKKSGEKKSGKKGEKKSEGGREKKTSLSGELGDDASAFFADNSYESAYKVQVDSFDDLKPEDTKDTAANRRFMVLTGAMFLLIVVAIVGLQIKRHYFDVQETVLQPLNPSEVLPTPPPSPPPQPEPPPAPPPTPAPPPAVAAIEDAAGANAPEAAVAVAAQDAASTTSAQTDAAVANVPATPDAAVARTAEVDAGAANAAADASANDPAALLAAARRARSRGPAVAAAAYEAWVAAGGNDANAMADFAYWLATAVNDLGRAGTWAERATVLAPTNQRAWFVLAASRLLGPRRDPAAGRDARNRCVSMGGALAAECRLLN